MILLDSIQVFYPSTHLARSRDSSRFLMPSGLDSELALHQIYHCAIDPSGTNGSSLLYNGAREARISLMGCTLHNSGFRNHICVPSALGRAGTRISP